MIRHSLWCAVGGAIVLLVSAQAGAGPSVAAGSVHGLKLNGNGTVWAWGDNEYGELGDGTTRTRPTPAPVGGLSGVVAVSANNAQNLALKGDGTVWAWGWNGRGQLGDGTWTQRTLPVQVAGLDGVSAVSARGLSQFGRQG